VIHEAPMSLSTTYDLTILTGLAYVAAYDY